MSIEFEIKTAFLKALSNLSAKKDLRTYLQGVAIICKDNELSLVAQGVPVFQYYFWPPEHAKQLQPTSTNHNIFPKNPSPATLHQTLHETYKTPFFSSPTLPRAKTPIFHH